MSKVGHYIEGARLDYIPILEKLREILLKEDYRLEEGWKWNAPNYDHKGMVCWMAHFKNHVGLNFFKGSLIEDLHGVYDEACMDKGNRMIKFRDISEVDEQILSHYLFEAVRLNVEGVKVAKKKIDTSIPDDFQKLLDVNLKAAEFFATLAPGYKRDYLEWIESAKREATREKRQSTSIEWLNEGKKKNWKYE
jgi:uncharacterized protein YdeI (YjbR/CyaY-like superfamily)